MYDRKKISETTTGRLEAHPPDNGATRSFVHTVVVVEIITLSTAMEKENEQSFVRQHQQQPPS